MQSRKTETKIHERQNEGEERLRIKNERAEMKDSGIDEREKGKDCD